MTIVSMLQWSTCHQGYINYTYCMLMYCTCCLLWGDAWRYTGLAAINHRKLCPIFWFQETKIPLKEWTQVDVWKIRFTVITRNINPSHLKTDTSEINAVNNSLICEAATFSVFFCLSIKSHSFNMKYKLHLPFLVLLEIY